MLGAQSSALQSISAPKHPARANVRLGSKGDIGSDRTTSALLPTTDIGDGGCDVRLVPTTEVGTKRTQSVTPGVLRAVAHPKGAQYHSGGLTPDFERGTDDDFCCSGRPCIGASGRALACGDDSFGTGLRVGRAIGRGGGADILG